MHIANALHDFLYDKEYFITYYEEKLYIYGYEEVYLISSETILLKIRSSTLKISGENLNVKQITKEELFVEGKINEIAYK